MREQYKTFKNLLIIDTTFGTNRFRLPLMFGVIVSNMGRSIVAFWALTSSETQEEFEWVFKSFKECFLDHPENILTDECASFKAAIKSNFGNTNHYICGWHKSNSIRRALSSKGCYQRKKRKNSFLQNFYLLEIKDSTEQSKYETLLTDIENLPYCLSQTDFESVIGQISQDEFLSKISYLSNLEENKEEWCTAYKKDSFILRTRTSQRVERMNWSLKSKISSQITLKELFSEFKPS